MVAFFLVKKKKYYRYILKVRLAKCCMHPDTDLIEIIRIPNIVVYHINYRYLLEISVVNPDQAGS